MAAIIRATAVRKGLFGGSRAWTVVWAILIGARLVKRFSNRQEVVYREVLQPGTGLVITSAPPG